MAHSLLVSFIGIAVIGLAGTPAIAKTPPAAKCLSAKLKAVGKKAAAKVACEAKAAQKLKPVDAACLAKAGTSFATAFSKAETQAKGACATTGDAAALETSVDALVVSVTVALPDGGTKDGGKCASSKRRASGKAASAELLCQSKAASKQTAVDPECVGKAEAAFAKAFARRSRREAVRRSATPAPSMRRSTASSIRSWRSCRRRPAPPSPRRQPRRRPRQRRRRPDPRRPPRPARPWAAP